MTDQPGYTTHLQGLLDRWNAGDESAIEEIIAHSQGRLRRMASVMLQKKPHNARWVETGDVLQSALIRLDRALKAVKPDSVRAFHGLAATQIRRELIDLARKLYGPEGHARHHQTDPGAANPEGNPRPLYEPADSATDAVGQTDMAEFHEHVGRLADAEREVFELIFYEGMTQLEVASLLGVSDRTIKRRWRDARLSLGRALGMAANRNGPESNETDE